MSASSPQSYGSVSSPTPAKQPRISHFMDKISASESERVDLLLAEFFYGCNVPFVACDSDYFKKFVNALRPAYSPPNRKKIATTLLYKVHEKIERRNTGLIAKMNRQATLLIDGWTNSNSNRHNVVTMLATSEDQKLFLESYDMAGLRESSDNLVEIVLKATSLAKERFDAEIYAVVSDNAPNMVSMGEKLPPTLMFTTCNSHTGNLLAKDFVGGKKYSNILNKVMAVQKDFKKPKLEARLKNAGGKKPVLYSVIRFASSRNALKSFLDNLSFMKRVAADEDEEGVDEDDEDAKSRKPDPSGTQLLFNASFVESVRKMYETMDPIGKLINLCQKSESSAADAIEEWLDLLDQAPAELQTLAQTRCMKSNVFNNVTIAANFLHPVYRGQKLSDLQKNEVNDYLFELLDSDGLESFRLFTSGEGFFSSLERKKITSPKTYWFYAMRQHSQLAKLATKLLLIPASTAQLERLFSNWSFVHSETRNRLSVETSKKLINVYFSLRSNDVCNDEEDNECEEII